jgi:DNA (cytosine-5)-methyltransferase 1
MMVETKAGNMREMKRVAEFFAGIGLMRAGLEQAGWRVAFANDIDPVKQRLYAHHFADPHDHFILGDIHQLEADRIPDVELATASFPCTDLSLAGRRAGLKGAQSSAFWGFVDLLRGMAHRRPPLVLLENVAGFLTSNKGQDFREALLALNALGYAIDAFVVNAAHFVPQSRVRLFIVGKQAPCRQGTSDIAETPLRPTNLVSFVNKNPDIQWDIRQEMPGLPEIQHGLETIVEDLPKSSPAWFSQDRTAYLLQQTFDRHLSKIRELQQRDSYTYLTAFRRVREGKSMAEIRFDGIAGCLRTPKGGSARQILLEVGKGEVNVRLLSPLECARLMGAGDFKLSGTANEALFGFGDAVCVPVVSWIAAHYLNAALDQYMETNRAAHATA